jgi:hypothetical protein
MAELRRMESTGLHTGFLVHRVGFCQLGQPENEDILRSETLKYLC